MELVHTKIESIFDILAQKGEYELDELVTSCPRFGSHQIFLEVNRPSRERQIRLVAKGCGVYVGSLAGIGSHEENDAQIVTPE